MPARRAFPLLLLLLLPALPALAGDLVFGAHGGYGAHTQEDLNAAIRLLNAAAGAAVADEVSGGAEWGGHVGMLVNESTILGVSFSRLAAATHGSAAGSFLDLEVPANCYLLFANWLPDSDKPGRLGLGADAGFLQVDGHAESQVPPAALETRHYEGEGLFLAVYVVGEVSLVGGLRLLTQGGFRLAQVPDLVIDGKTTGDALDYSGIFLRAGLRFAP